MSIGTDQELQAWMAEWAAPDEPILPPEAIRQHVARRSRLLVVVMTVETIFGGTVLAFLLHRAATHTDPIERVAMSLLAAITAATLAFGYWNWRGTLRASAETTATFIELSLERCRRLRRLLTAGWWVLAAEAVVFAPWVVHRAGWPWAPGASRWPWAFLGGMLALGAIYLLGLNRWVTRETRAVESMRQETADQ